MQSFEQTNTRFLEYKNVLKKLKALGFSKVFSSNLADSLGVSASLVRKDFLTLSTKGNKRGGYNIETLLEEISRLMCKEVEIKVVLVGLGKLGAALCEYQGFKDENMTISAAFDINPSKLDTSGSVPVHHVDSLSDYICSHNIKMGIVTVPSNVAQRIADTMVLAGVNGILNFAPVRLALPGNCYENHINLAIELEKVALKVAAVAN